MFCTIVLRRRQSETFCYKIIFTSVYNLSIYKTVSIETSTQHFIYDNYNIFI